MGFLDLLKSTPSEPTFTKQQALMTVAVAAVKADGSVSRTEYLRLRAMCSLSPLFVDNNSDQDQAIIEFADEITTNLGFDAVSKAAATLSQSLRETAFSFAADMILADGRVGEKEQKFLAELVRVLGISEQVGASVVYCTLLRNREE